MPANAYVGIDNIARKVKAIYIGIDGVAHKVKNGFIGVAGIARKFFSSAIVPDVTAISQLSLSSDQVGLLGMPGKTANHLIYGPGNQYSSNSLSFNDELVSTMYTYPNGIGEPASSEFQEFAFFLGGRNIDVYDRTYNSTYTYNDDLVAQARTVLPTITDSNATYLGAYSVFNNALLYANWDTTGSFKNEYGPFQIQFDHDFVMTKSSYPVTKKWCCSASNSKYWFNIGGENGKVILNNVDAISTDLVHSSTTTLNTGYGYSSMEINGLACRLGYYTEASATGGHDVVDGFDENLIRSNPFNLGIDMKYYSGEKPYTKIESTPLIKGTGFLYLLDSDFVKTTYNYPEKIGDFRDFPYAIMGGMGLGVYTLGRTNNNLLIKYLRRVNGTLTLVTVPLK